MFKSNKKSGFTLIELLVVIAIIGVLASVVLASLNSARKKSRDARRVADIKQIQLALELYSDSKGEYPDDLSKLAPDFIASEPKDPVGQIDYLYNSYISSTIEAAGDCVEASAVCLYYHLGANLEESTNPALKSDRDFDGDVVKGAESGTPSVEDGCSDETTRFCYDVTP